MLEIQSSAYLAARVKISSLNNSKDSSMCRFKSSAGKTISQKMTPTLRRSSQFQTCLMVSIISSHTLKLVKRQ